ncbi:GGDEF domain-containing protein [Hydrogenimonas sp.]|uniref:GGDEF domain-containing protein n=1 Tax=Hydrogenimonas sp. TaxID=2231112 RepID=UPI002617F4CE|nr:GGDEF domain-containing protein [Hydrogenimonas sp.]
MLKFDKPVWKIAVEAFFAAVAASTLMTGFQWILINVGVGGGSNLLLALMSAAYLTFFLLVFYHLLRQKAMIDRVKKEEDEQMLRDETTRLYKSKVFKELAGTQIRMCKRNSWPVGMVIMDIDRLGMINKTYGFDAGNQVLKHFATIIKESVRESDLVARFDDDRFALLLPNCDARNAKRVIQRIQNHILSEPLKVGKATIKIPFSSGVVSFAGKVAKFNHLVNRATEALEQAKRKGGNRIELF